MVHQPARHAVSVDAGDGGAGQVWAGHGGRHYVLVAALRSLLVAALRWRFDRLLLASLDNRFFGQPGGALRRRYVLVAALRWRFDRLLLASLDNPHIGGPGGALRRRYVLVAALRCASIGSCSLRSTIPTSAARRRTAPPLLPALPRVGAGGHLEDSGGAFGAPFTTRRVGAVCSHCRDGPHRRLDRVYSSLRGFRPGQRGSRRSSGWGAPARRRRGHDARSRDPVRQRAGDRCCG